MMEELILARWQFALTSIYHWIFVPVTLGMTILVALMEVKYATTKNEEYKKMAKFWGKLFLINFAMGVVTGIVQEFHFGMNWAEYSRFMGDIFGAPLALEALTAFFLESTFMGVWIFGWDKLSAKAHAFVACLVAIGTNLSAFWILVANSFMQHPVGYALRNGRAEMTDFFAILSNGYVPGQYTHIFMDGILTAGTILTAVSAWHLLRENAVDFYKRSMHWGLTAMVIGGLLVAGTGHHHGQYVAQVQPMKMAAIEALWETADPAPFSVVAAIDEENQRNTAALEVPGALSFLTQNSFTSGKVEGIKDLQAQMEATHGPGDYIPPVTPVFWTFRVMVGFGTLLLIIGAMALFGLRRGCLPYNRKMLTLLFWCLPIPFIANTTGWFVAEVGRQPWIVYGLQTTQQGLSATVTAAEIWTSMIGFTVVYILAAIAAFYLAAQHVKKGPAGNPSHDVVEVKEEARLWN